MDSESTKSCEALTSPSLTNFGLSLFILIGILVSYLPQHWRIIRRRSSFGLSPYFVLLGATSGTCQFATILVLPRSRADIACCREISGFDCFAGLLGIAQVGTQWACFTAILLLFLIFFPRTTKPLEAAGLGPDVEGPSIHTALAVTAVSLIHGLVTFVLSGYFILLRPSSLQSWANFLGIVSTVLASVQYLPQIYTTYRLKKVASLSIPMMCIQTPGAFVFAASLAARLGTEGWSAWGVFVVSGCLQGTLLGMGVYYELRARNGDTKVAEPDPAPSEEYVDGSSTDPDSGSERRPLLQSVD